MKHSANKIKIAGYNDLFGSSAPILAENVVEQVIEVPLEELHTFHNHPFRVLDDEKMEETVASIKDHGILMPGIATPPKNFTDVIHFESRQWKYSKCKGAG